jgi:calcineurin-like phosphoesterase family protein
MWVVSDTHIGHARIREYGRRPDDHEQLIRSRWRDEVKDTDWVLHLGDIALKPQQASQFMLSMPGRKALVYGNHDRSAPKFYREQCGIEVCSSGFELVHDGWRVLVSHRPDYNREFVRFPRRLNVHGHTHNRALDDRHLISVCVEMQDYRPVRLRNLLDARIADLVS